DDVAEPEGGAMSRFQWALVAVIAGELVVGAVLFHRQRNLPTPPVGELSYLDPLAAEQVRDLIQNCRSPDDWARLGEAYLAFGYFPEAEACNRVAAEGGPGWHWQRAAGGARAEHAYDWAFALERLGRLEEANRGYELALRLGHSRPGDCWYFIGRNWLRQE